MVTRSPVMEKEMATHSSILAWRSPWTEEPCGLQSTRSQRVRHDLSDLAHISILTWKIPWTEELMGCNPWGCKESNMTEHAHVLARQQTPLCKAQISTPGPNHSLSQPLRVLVAHSFQLSPFPTFSFLKESHLTQNHTSSLGAQMFSYGVSIRANSQVPPLLQNYLWDQWRSLLELALVNVLQRNKPNRRYI